MTAITLLLFIVVFIPIMAVAYWHMLWDIKFWDQLEYKAKNLFISIRFSFTHQKQELLFLITKFILISTVSISILNRNVEFVVLFISLLFAVYVNQFIDIVKKLVKFKLIFLPKTWDVTFIVGMSSLALFTIISIVLGIILENTVFSINVETVTGFNTNTIYWLFYMVFFGAVIDLLTPIWVSLIVLIYKPIKAIRILIKERFISNTLAPETINISIIGSYGKTTTKKILNNLLLNDYEVFSADNTSNTIEDIINQIKSFKSINIIDVNFDDSSEAKRISKLLKSKLIIFTGINENENFKFRNQAELLKAYRSYISNSDVNAQIIFNSEDQIARSISENYENIHPIYTSEVPGKTVPGLELIESKINVANWISEFKLELNNHKMEFITASSAYNSPTSTLLAIYTAFLLGLNTKTISQKISKLGENTFSNISTYKGDLNTQIIHQHNNPTINSIEKLIDYSKKYKNTDTILVLKSLNWRNIELSDIDKLLVKLSNKKIHTIITYDKTLYNKIKAQTKIISISVSNDNMLMEEIRIRIEPQDLILICGDIDNYIVNELKSN